MVTKILTSLFSLGIALLVGCTKDKAPGECGGCSEKEVSYQNDITPLIQQSCATNLGAGTGCHDAWIFEYENLKARVESGDIWRVVVSTKTMPKVPNNFGIEPLTDAELDLFKCWICNGAPNN